MGPRLMDVNTMDLSVCIEKEVGDGFITRAVVLSVGGCRGRPRDHVPSFLQTAHLPWVFPTFHSTSEATSNTITSSALFWVFPATRDVMVDIQHRNYCVPAPPEIGEC